MSEEEDVDAVSEAVYEADEILHFSILQFMAMDQNANVALRLLGLQMSLLRHASRVLLTQRLCCGAQTTKAEFGRLARQMYEEVAALRTKQLRAKPPKGKRQHLKVVK
jgi:hypothetical protein